MILVKSMTGYGRAVETVNGREFTVELRSVNNRYLDCTVKLPRSLSFGEDAVKQTVKNVISRGKVDVFISVRSEGAADVKITLNEAMAAGYLAAMKQMAESCGVKDDISVSVISRMPDVFTVEKPEVDEEQLLADLLGVVNKALASFDAMRTAEGKALENDLRSRGGTILALVAQVEAGSAQTVLDYRTRLENKIKEVLASTTIDESRILTEAAIFADKVAVDEETVRLRSHLEQMNSMLTSGGAIGRKLDFLLQEMNREANTIGSKCSDVRLARIVVDIKAELEKIREQTQNIE
ncbi:MAG: YicC/YloC family endoribonuclease [Faecousia sp.]